MGTARQAGRRRAPTPADWGLLGLLVVLVPFVWTWRHPSAAPQRLEVSTANSRFELDPRRPAAIALAGPAGVTRLCVGGGAAWVGAAPCGNQLCRRLGPIRRAGQSLVCVPNRIVVRFTARDVDGVTR